MVGSKIIYVIDNMGIKDLTDMYAQGPQARVLRAYISGKSQVTMLAVICISSITYSTLKFTQTYS